MKLINTFICVIMTMLFYSCFEYEGPYSKLSPGLWRAELSLTPRNISPNKKGQPLKEKLNLQFDEVMDGQLPFMFEVKYTNDSTFVIEIINGEERIQVKDIHYGRDRKTGKDTLLMRFPEYESYISAICEGGIMEGEFVITSKENYRIPFTAKQGQSERFSNLRKKPYIDISGSWETTFDLNTDQNYKAIGLFNQKGNMVTGTFKTETGDFRYLEGTIQNKKIYLSCFDGSHAFLFEAKIQDNNTLSGSFRSGLSEPSIWEAKKNADFKLNNPDSITQLKQKNIPIDFSFAGPDGKNISLNDAAYKSKVKIIQIMGTWCPNCKDESMFLANYLKTAKDKDIAVIGLAFERHKEATKAYTAIGTYKKQLDIPYEILYVGTNDKKEASTKIPFLESIKAYPTLLILDKKNHVRKVHTGFNGPATDEFNTFKVEFGTFIDLLLKE